MLSVHCCTRKNIFFHQTNVLENINTNQSQTISSIIKLHVSNKTRENHLVVSRQSRKVPYPINICKQVSSKLKRESRGLQGFSTYTYKTEPKLHFLLNLLHSGCDSPKHLNMNQSWEQRCVLEEVMKYYYNYRFSGLLYDIKWTPKSRPGLIGRADYLRGHSWSLIYLKRRIDGSYITYYPMIN